MTAYGNIANGKTTSGSVILSVWAASYAASNTTSIPSYFSLYPVKFWSTQTSGGYQVNTPFTNDPVPNGKLSGIAYQNSVALVNCTGYLYFSLTGMLIAKVTTGSDGSFSFAYNTSSPGQPLALSTSDTEQYHITFFDPNATYQAITYNLLTPHT